MNPAKARTAETPSDGLEGVDVRIMVRKAVEDTLGTEGPSLLNIVRQLNELGQNRARSLVEELLKIREYRKQN